MLNTKQIDIIKATAPVVGANAGAITSHFYPLMFERYPSVKTLFNQTHQQKGTQPQALANALVAYATNIDELGNLSEAVSLIVHKHCSLNILPEHYPIVGECLMEAIGAVLGDAVTAEVADAWQTAYQQLANLLIDAEEKVYQMHSERQGGWRGERDFKLTRIVKESDVISSFYFSPCAGESVIDFTAGQYIGLVLNINGTSVRRNYSLSDAPGKTELRISVKREDDGLVSGYLHNQLKEGEIVSLIAPAGDFVLKPSERPVVFITGGVGITPAISMLNSCVDSAKEVVFIHAAINSAHHAFAKHIQDLTAQYDNLSSYVIYEKPLAGDQSDGKGFLTKELLQNALNNNLDVDLYFLGPKPFMMCVNKIADELGIPTSQRHHEFFGPAEELLAG